ncbi:OpgC domain-containing protein [Elioraea sp.]|uniref:OpgC domain-containing protein n=1 Tax=Elioraea sp. TaxID=2185103 RepID=UPI003F72183B
MRPAPPRPPRDPRLDIIRGILQLFIFFSHSAGTFTGSWLIHASWGLSDSSEQFLFLSGFVLGSLFVRNAGRDGPVAAIRDFLVRTFRLYRTHLLVVALFALMVFVAERVFGLPDQIGGLGWAWLFEDPAESLPALALMLYRPVFMDILPVFVWCMLALPFLMLALDGIGRIVLMLPFGLYAGVQIWDWTVPAPGNPHAAFNPLAWQVLFFLGAVLGRRALLTGSAVRSHPVALAFALGVLAIGLWLRVLDHGWMVGPQIDVTAVTGKLSLAPARVVHALALAYAVAVLVPREAAWMRHASAAAVAAIGRHSLQVFCLGLFLAWGIATTFSLVSWAWWIELPLILGGSFLLWTLAVILDTRRAGAVQRRLPAAERPAPAARLKLSKSAS